MSSNSSDKSVALTPQTSDYQYQKAVTFSTAYQSVVPYPLLEHTHTSNYHQHRYFRYPNTLDPYDPCGTFLQSLSLYESPISRKPIKAFDEEMYNAALELLRPVKHIYFEDKDGKEIATNDTGQQLFIFKYNPSHNKAETKNSDKNGILNLQGKYIIKSEFPEHGRGEVADFMVGNLVIGTAFIPIDLCWPKNPTAITISSSSSVSTNPSKFTFTFESNPYAATSFNCGGKTESLHAVQLREIDGNSIVVAEFSRSTKERPDIFCISFLDPELDAEAKMLLLAITPYVRTSMRESCSFTSALCISLCAALIVFLIAIFLTVFIVVI